MAPHRPVRTLAATSALLVLATGCAGTSGGEQGPVEVSSATPASGPAPQIGAASAGGLTVTGVAVHGTPARLTVTGSIGNTGTPDDLISVGTNYTDTAVLPEPLPIPSGAPVALSPGTVTLRSTGALDVGATLAVAFIFRAAGPVQAFATYTP